MRFVWTAELVNEINDLSGDELTREKLSEKLNCHVNTVYNYEKILRENLEILKDAKKYYENEDGSPKKWVELNEYLCWLICKVKDLHGLLKGKNKHNKIRGHFFAYWEYYTEERWNYEVKQRTEKTVEQPEQAGEWNEERGRTTAA